MYLFLIVLFKNIISIKNLLITRVSYIEVVQLKLFMQLPTYMISIFDDNTFELSNND